ncbi:hypothetical protein TVAG_118990 [Trichomonas vaginalis G3]|uniref:Splicing factor Cactin C-terminal domain-containing protein n=1 Tax=Trichomonas vaginalis (strain ATCC PRA-98 / G3) TaxID=412133 RepID=A2D746_TRIV3|nr:negative regulation of type I interferon-mediated signaling pathway [Trichomonas vaginalis G3]EAY23563.1 hypothetical protein TVAG_118990 [Trichomonas vaginalis G3]KAI5490061.1 negative regulation of type I interferon-mediated signaling pathway [Trichomonas vaginalis G3]|eukprot:XP_001276811.1 hypothetical protein [Trichomonas vaginalis G3]
MAEETPLIFQNDEDLNRERLIKGSVRRLKEERPNLFDNFFINWEGAYDKNITHENEANWYPSICSPYILLDTEGVKKYLELNYPRNVPAEDIETLISNVECFVTNAHDYWYYIKLFLEFRSEEVEENLITPFNEDIIHITDISVDELEALFHTFALQQKFDIEDHAEFYKQLFHRMKFLLSTAWLDRYHNNLLKKTIKLLPKRELAKFEEGDVSFLTKTQKKFKQRLLMQENGQKMFNHFSRRYFDARRHIQSEHPTKLMPQLSIEGMQYWGDEEVEFNDTIQLKLKVKDGSMVIPDFEAVQYMGYDWNVHKRQKYDPDHPPPKSIRGYCFRIYYPALADKVCSPPRYRLCPEYLDPNEPVPDPNYRYTAILFEAEKPYLPICFRIVDKQWDERRTGGIRRSFIQGVFTFQITFVASLYYKGYIPEQLY